MTYAALRKFIWKNKRWHCGYVEVLNVALNCVLILVFIQETQAEGVRTGHPLKIAGKVGKFCVCGGRLPQFCPENLRSWLENIQRVAPIRSHQAANHRGNKSFPPAARARWPDCGGLMGF